MSNLNEQVKKTEKLSEADNSSHVQLEPDDFHEEYYSENDKFQDHLLEQYKIYIEMMDRISSRRLEGNKFYLTILSSLVALIAIIVDKDISQFKENKFQAFVFITISILGIFLCANWFLGIQSNKSLNRNKFKVIKDMETRLPYSCYGKEWEYLKGDLRKSKKVSLFLTSTSADRVIPLAFSILYIGFLIYSLLIFF